MTDVRRGYDDNAENQKTFVSVKNLRKEFGEKPSANNDDDDDDKTFMSVKERLRRFDTRQDKNDCDYDNSGAPHIRESIGSITTPVSSAVNTPRKRFSQIRSPSSKSMLLDSLATNATDPKAYPMDPPITVSFLSETENRSSSSLKENSSGTEGFKYGNVLLKKVEKPVEDWRKRNMANESSTDDQHKDAQGPNRVSSYVRKPQPYNNRGMSSPAGLTKVGLWKGTKKAEEEASDSSKPIFAIMKLRTVGTPASHASQAASPYDLDDKKSTLAKRQRVPTTADIAQTSGLCYGHRNKGSAEGIRVSDLAKTFSSNIKLASNGERAEEEKVIRRSSGVNEINYIRSSLKSSKTELEEMRKSLNSSTPVAKLIAERNRAAQANRSETRNIFGLPDDRRKSYGRTRSKSVGRSANTHRRNKSMSSTQTKNSSSDGNPTHDQVRRDSVSSLEGFSNICWEEFKASNPSAGSNIWDMNLDGSAFFGAHSNARSCTALDELSGGKDNLLPSNSTISEYTTDSDAHYDYDNYGHSSFIQLTLSSGGIVEKFEPLVCMTATDDSSAEYQSEYGMDMSIDPTMSDSKHSTRKALKGAKNFFFGKNKRKNGPIEV
mmetsp:Transcript_3481/g.8288  ORF Transcript_3481/g.8288 Transcript_3481/m.8288 type:complete len:605 (+) Transcript_3481:256-2070(+)